MKLCLLPLGRVLIEDIVELTDGVVLYPPRHFSIDTLRVVWSPHREIEAMCRRYGVEFPDGTVEISVSDSELQWFKSAATGINADELLNEPLLAVSLEVNWDAFLAPESHEWHLEQIKRAIEKAEAAMNLVRLKYCNPWLVETLPGKVGLLRDTTFTCGLFFDSVEHESYLIGGHLITHQIIIGIGLDMNDVHKLPALGNGGVGYIAKHALTMMTQALEANTETSKYIQLLSLLEYLAVPDGYENMRQVKKLIARHVAKDRAKYDKILERFKYLTSDENGGTNRGLRHNIVHVGKRLEDLVPDANERRAIFRELWCYVFSTLSDFIEKSFDDWSSIEAIRNQASLRFGLT